MMVEDDGRSDEPIVTSFRMLQILEENVDDDDSVASVTSVCHVAEFD
jgi:hypothetical protein